MTLWQKLAGVPGWFCGWPHTNAIIGNELTFEAWERMAYGGVQVRGQGRVVQVDVAHYTGFGGYSIIVREGGL